MYILKYALYNFFRFMLVRIFEDKRKRVSQNFDKYCEKIPFLLLFKRIFKQLSFVNSCTIWTKDVWKGIT